MIDSSESQPRKYLNEDIADELLEQSLKRSFKTMDPSTKNQHLPRPRLEPNIDLLRKKIDYEQQVKKRINPTDSELNPKLLSIHKMSSEVNVVAGLQIGDDSPNDISPLVQIKTPLPSSTCFNKLNDTKACLLESKDTERSTSKVNVNIVSTLLSNLSRIFV